MDVEFPFIADDKIVSIEDASVLKGEDIWQDCDFLVIEVDHANKTFTIQEVGVDAKLLTVSFDQVNCFEKQGETQGVTPSIIYYPSIIRPSKFYKLESISL